MTKFCTQTDVEQRLRRELTEAESDYLDGMIEEAQLLVLSYLGHRTTPYTTGQVPQAIRVVTSRMVARVIQEADTAPEYFGASQIGETAGPFSQQVTFQTGSRLGSPWLAKADRETLNPYRHSGKAFSIDTAPRLPQYTPEGERQELLTGNLGWEQLIRI